MRKLYESNNIEKDKCILTSKYSNDPESGSRENHRYCQPFITFVYLQS